MVILFGLSGNPIHNGHLHILAEVEKKLGTHPTEIMVTPGHNMKAQHTYASFSQRLQMAELATEEHENWTVSDFEGRLLVENENARTWEVLKAWKKKFPEKQPIWLMGADSWHTFNRWENHADILQTVPMIIVPRVGYHTDPLTYPVAFQYRDLKRTKEEILNGVPGWLWLDIPATNESATEIRDALRHNAQPQGLPPKVKNYIYTHALYTKTRA